jgi:hypothetical protein
MRFIAFVGGGCVPHRFVSLGLHEFGFGLFSLVFINQ